MIKVVNESPASYFDEQMRIRKALAREEWNEMQEPSINLDGFYYDVLQSCFSFDDYWEREQDRAFHDMTANCIRELRRQSIMELS